MTVLSAQDAYVSQAKATTKYGSASVLQTRTQTSNNMLAYVKPAGALNRPGSAAVASAKLRLNIAESFSGSETFTVKLVTKEFTPATVTWNNRPTSTATGSVSIVVSSPALNTQIEFDVSALLASALGSGVLFGFEISSSSSTIRKFHSVEATSPALRPSFEVDWKTAPDAPTFLNPSKALAVGIPRPTFTFNYNDSSGLSGMSAYEFELDYSDSSFASPDYSSGVVVSDSPLHTLTTDLVEGDSFFWRVRVRNISLEWSAWSVAAESIFVSKETVTIDSPTATVGQLTPPVLWTVSGSQSAFQIIETDPLSPTTIRQDSFVQVGSDDSFTLAKPLDFSTGLTRIEVRVWDSVARTPSPGDEVFSSDFVVLDFAPLSTVDPVTDLVADPVGFAPIAQITWNYASVPDQFVIYRDGKFVALVDGADAFVSGTSFLFKDALTGSGDHVWEVFPVVDGETSDSSPAASAKLSGRFVWLVDPDDSEFLIPMNSQLPLGAFAEQSDVVTPAGSTRSVIKSFALRGREDSFEGTFDARVNYLPPVALDVLEARLADLKRKPVKTWRLVVGRENIPVILRNVSWFEQPGSDGSAVVISFEYFQQAETGW